ncbi:MAG TPA: hypothetical protein VGE53_00410 [Candidatus Paceibacterota bacterium]
MAHHAYLYVGGKEDGIEAVRAYAARELSLKGIEHPDIAIFSYDGLFSVDDARAVNRFALQAPIAGDKKLVAIATGRIYHEAQNALLKTFEEPQEGTTLVLIVPTEGIVLPTLRSRLQPLPGGKRTVPAEAQTFIVASKAEREKFVTKLLARAKSDKDLEKQAARMEAARIVEGLLVAAHAARAGAAAQNAKELDLLLSDLSRFMPIMHQSSAPLKLIFEHLLLVLPAKL